MPGNQSVERAILIGWTMVGWAGLIVLAGLTTLMLLDRFSHFIPAGRWHDLIATLFVMLVWPPTTLAFRFCAKHGLWILLGL
jgi:chromate transport protein ChrA